jgi:hypothetical protein
MKKIRILSADFGTAGTKNTLDIPKQDTSEFEIETFKYTDSNYYSREKSLSPRLKGKIPKMLDWMTNDADYYIWVDSYYTITSTKIHELVKYVSEHQICLNKHFARTSILQELQFMIREMTNAENPDPYLLERYKGEPLEAQVSSYLKDTTFIDNSLYALGFFIYKKSLVESVNNLMSDWFFHNCYWSVQDQLSMPYLLQKHNITPNIFDFDAVLNNPYAVYTKL